MKFPFLALTAALSATCGFAQVRVTFTQDSSMTGPGPHYPVVQACNATGARQWVVGWRFRTPNYAGYTTFLPGLTHAGAGPVEYTQARPESEQVMQAGQCPVGGVDYTANPTAGQDATLSNAQALIKIGTCHEEPPVADRAPLACTALSSVTLGAGYFHNGCLPPPQALGGVVAAFNHTQLQVAIPLQPFSDSGASMRWEPRVMGPQYMMALTAVQELYHLDWRVLAAMAAKETGFGMVVPGQEAKGSRSEDGSYIDMDGIASAWQIEDISFLRLLHLYPSVFPAYGPCFSRYPDLINGVSGCTQGPIGEPAAFYLRATGSNRMTPDASTIINGAVTAAHMVYAFYDALMQSTDIPYPRVLTEAADKRLGLAPLIAGYNLGLRSGFEAPLRDADILQDSQGSKRFPSGNNHYRPWVFSMLDHLEDAAAKAIPCQGAAPLYDTALAFPDIQRFFFGGTPQAPGTPGAQGPGGLLRHFDLAPKGRDALLADLQCAFQALKGQGPAAGKEAISFRYDWLALLRVAKARLPVHREPAPENDFRAFVQLNSKKPLTSEGKAKDAVFPKLTVNTDKPVVAEASALRIDEWAYDSLPGVRAYYSLDSLGRSWSPEKTSPDTPLRIPCDHPDLPAPGKPGRLWVRAVDACGNATVQEVPFELPSGWKCGDPVATTPRAAKRGMARSKLSREGGTIGIAARRSELDGDAELRDLIGRHLKAVTGP